LQDHDIYLTWIGCFRLVSHSIQCLNGLSCYYIPLPVMDSGYQYQQCRHLSCINCINVLPTSMGD